MGGQPQVIVRRKVDDPLPIKRADRRLLVVKHTQLEVRALGLEFVELVSEVGKRVSAGCGGHGRLRTSLPQIARIENETNLRLVILRRASALRGTLRQCRLPVQSKRTSMLPAACALPSASSQSSGVVWSFTPAAPLFRMTGARFI